VVIGQQAARRTMTRRRDASGTARRSFSDETAKIV
jgi:hypothetical protein